MPAKFYLCNIANPLSLDEFHSTGCKYRICINQELHAVFHTDVDVLKEAAEGFVSSAQGGNSVETCAVSLKVQSPPVSHDGFIPLLHCYSIVQAA